MSTWTVSAHTAAAHETRLRYCDRCGATARFEVVLPSGHNLLFCAHHAYAHTDALCEIGAVLPISQIDLDYPDRHLLGERNP